MAKTGKVSPKEKIQESKSIVEEFKDFISRGNVIDIAVGLTVGTAFTKVANSLVSNIIMPPIGLILGGSAFTDLFVSLDGKLYGTLLEAEAASAPILKYGQFISDLVDFFVIALAIFVVVKVAIRIQSFRLNIAYLKGRSKTLKSFVK